MNDLRSYCDDIVQHLAAMGRPIQRLLKPGLSDEQVKLLVSDFPLTLPNSIIDLYKWHNGTTNEAGGELIPGYSFEPLEECIRLYQLLAEDDQSSSPAEWLPFFRSGGADFYGIRCSHRQSEDAEIIHDDNELGQSVMFPSLLTMFRTLQECYRTGIFFVTANGTLSLDPRRYEQAVKDDNRTDSK